MSIDAKSALLILNLQNDFCNDGPVTISGSLDIIPKINRIKQDFTVVIYTKNWHPKDHIIFKEDELHCVQFTEGAELHSGLTVDEAKDYTFHKGTNQKYSSGSAFYESKSDDIRTILDKILDENDISRLYVCGIAVKNSVYSTLLDSIKFRYETYLIVDVTSGISSKIEQYNNLTKIGVKIVKSDSLFIKS